MACLDTARAAAKEVGMPESRIILIGDARDESWRIQHFQSMKNLSGVTRYRRAKIDPRKDLAFLVYSSGTTGYPKGVMLNHTNIVSNIMMLTVTEGGQLSWNGGRDGAGDRTLAFLPFFHIYGTGWNASIVVLTTTSADEVDRAHLHPAHRYLPWAGGDCDGEFRPATLLPRHPAL